MKYFFLVVFVGFFFACNNIPEAIMLANTERIDTIDFKEYHYVVDKKDRRGYVMNDNEIMDGHYVIKRDEKIVEEVFITGGFLHGDRILYNEHELPESIETYKTSVQHGPVISFYPSGAIRSEASYTNGKKDVEEIHYDENGTITEKTIVTNGITYEHTYRDGNRMLSIFKKSMNGKEFDLLMKYDAFGTVALIIGKPTQDDAHMIHVFDADFNEIDRFNGQEDPLKAQQYLAVFQSW